VSCPGELELARALADGGDAEIAAHLAACASCRAVWDGARAAIELARELPVALPSAARREEVRTAILATAGGPAQRPPRRAWHAPAVLLVGAAGVVGYLALRASSPSTPHAHGTLRPHTGARYVVSSVGPDEVIRLSDGALDIEVEPLHAGERFRVMVGTAELEVRGTAFHVTASAERLVEVTVARGRVDLTPDRGAPSTLAAGQAWHADVAERAPSLRSSPASSAAIERRDPEPSAVHREPLAERRDREPSERREPPAARRDREPSAERREPPAARRDREPSPSAIAPAERRDRDPSPPPAPRAAEELAYDDAWTALRTGDFARAAGGFARVVLLAPDSPLVEDASFWRAVALARGKRSAEAVSAFRDFLDGFARSPRAGEASAMLGWLLIDARALDEAARRFTAASADPDPKVRDSARAGLDALARRKP